MTITTDAEHPLISSHVVEWHAQYEDSDSDWQVTIDSDGTISGVGFRTNGGPFGIVRGWQGVQPGDVTAARRFFPRP